MWLHQGKAQNAYFRSRSDFQKRQPFKDCLLTAIPFISRGCWHLFERYGWRVERYIVLLVSKPKQGMSNLTAELIHPLLRLCHKLKLETYVVVAIGNYWTSVNNKLTKLTETSLKQLRWFDFCTLCEFLNLFFLINAFPRPFRVTGNNSLIARYFRSMVTQIACALLKQLKKKEGAHMTMFFCQVGILIYLLRRLKLDCDCYKITMILC